MGAWQGVMVPSKTAPEIVKKLNQEIMKALGSADVRAKLALQGAEPLGSSPEEYAAYVNSELARWEIVVRQTGASLDQ